MILLDQSPKSSGITDRLKPSLKHCIFRVINEQNLHSYGRPILFFHLLAHLATIEASQRDHGLTRETDTESHHYGKVVAVL